MAYSTQDHIAIQANTLNNQSLNGLAPVIASRGDLDLGVQVLNNLENNLNHQSGSQIIAMGDLRIGGSLDSQWHAQGTAQQVNNRSSVINANGNIDLNADTVNNQNVFFTTKQQQTTEQLDYWNMYISDSRAGWYNPGPQSLITQEIYSQNPDLFTKLKPAQQLVTSYDNATMQDYLSRPDGYFFIVNNYDDSSAGNMFKGYVVYNGQLYSTDHYENVKSTQTTTTTVADESAPAVISAGGNLSFTGTINNDKSQIMVGQKLIGDAKAIHNVDAKGPKITQEEGTVTPSYGSYGGKGHDRVWASAEQAYNPADVTKGVDLFIYENPTSATPVKVQDQTQQVNKDNLAEQALSQNHESTIIGQPWENYIQSTSPATTIDLNSIKSNFKAFDHFDPATGLATSDKTLNTAAKTYQDPKKITSQINKYIDQMDNFTGDNKGRFELTNDKIKSKEMQLAIPVNTSKSQLDAIQKSIDYANTKGITIKVTKVK